MKSYSLRPATAADAGGMLKIYEHYVCNSAATFEYEPPDEAEFRGRIERLLPYFPCLVCECDGQVAGYAYASKHRERTAYQWSPECTIYISEAHHGTGIARILYEALFDILRQQGFINLYASVLSTNINSNRFHKTMGFEEIGTFTNVGYKLGEWRSNNWYQLPLAKHVAEPPPPRAMTELAGTDRYTRTFAIANAKLEALADTKRKATL